MSTLENSDVDPDRKVRVGVVGVGYLGSIHARIYARMPNVELVGVCDTDATRAASVAHENGCAVWANPQDAIGAIDAVSVVVPTSLHGDIANPFLDAGVHTLLEKPVAHTVASAEEIVARADASGAILQIGHLERFNAGVMEVARRVKDPEFIEVHRLGTFVERATDVDVVTDLMIHDIDIVLTLVKSELTSLSAIGTRVVTDHVDIANARLEFASGAVANVTASRVSSKKFRRMRIFGDRNYLGLDFSAQTIDVVTTGEKEPGQNFAPIVQDRVVVEGAQPLDAELDHFVEMVSTGGEPHVTGLDGLNALKVAAQVREQIGSRGN